jgi:hypothetical protein
MYICVCVCMYMCIYRDNVQNVYDCVILCTSMDVYVDIHVYAEIFNLVQPRWIGAYATKLMHTCTPLHM